MHTDIHALSGFEPTIPAFERAKTVHALDRAATVIGGFGISGAEVLDSTTAVIATSVLSSSCPVTGRTIT
jgi:hypothetical protein